MAHSSIEICELLDERLAPVIADCMREVDADPSVKRGATVGFLLKTGAALAFDDGMARADLKRIMERVLTELYG